MGVILTFLSLVFIYFGTSYIGRHVPYKKAYGLFEIAHFISGFLLAKLFSFFIDDPVLIVAATMSVGLLWEFLEIAIDRLVKFRKLVAKIGIKMGPITLSDTLLDLFLDTSAAIIFVWLFR